MYAGAMAAVPLLVMACVYLALDPFKVLRWHDNPFDDRLGLNKGMLSVQAYARDVAGQKYDSFIMGSSVSCAYPVREWMRYLPEGSRPIHIDSSGQTVGTLRKFLEYLEAERAELRNVLIVFAPEVFGMEYDPENLSTLVPPAVERGGVPYFLSFHYRYFSGFANFRYLSPLLVYEFTGRREEHTDVPVFSPQPIVYDASVNEELMPEWDRRLDDGAASFHGDNIQHRFLPPDAPYTILPPQIGAEEKRDLETIAAILARNGADYRVILAPTPKLYLLPDKDERVLGYVFGERFVNLSHDFRAEQSDMSNFYDTIHYRPRLACRYMEKAYSK